MNNQLIQIKEMINNHKYLINDFYYENEDVFYERHIKKLSKDELTELYQSIKNLITKAYFYNQQDFTKNEYFYLTVSKRMIFPYLSKLYVQEQDKYKHILNDFLSIFAISLLSNLLIYSITNWSL